ncbi:hypothetical protein [Streptomyces sp. SGAir0957]
MQSPLVAAEAAVDTLVRELWAPRVVVGCGDVLAQRDLAEDTVARLREWHAIATASLKLICFAIATRTTDRLLDAFTASR